jgi:hypothetical protein
MVFALQTPLRCDGFQITPLMPLSPLNITLAARRLHA